MHIWVTTAPAHHTKYTLVITTAGMNTQKHLKRSEELKRCRNIWKFVTWTRLGMGLHTD
jgi:hypothetical protein